MSSVLFSSPVNILKIVLLNFPSSMLLTSVLPRSLAMALSCFHLEYIPVLTLSKSFPSLCQKSQMSPASESNGLKKRSCSAQSLALQGVSSVCTLFAQLWYFGCFILQASYMQRLSLPALGSIGLNVANFNQVYSGLLVKGDLTPTPLELRFCRIFCLVIQTVVWAEVCGGLLGEGPTILRQRQT